MRMTLAATVACLALIGVSTAHDADAAIKRTTDIPAQPLAPALQTLIKERDIQLVYRAELIGDRRTGGASGELTAIEALSQLLSGTGLTYKYLDDRTVTILPLPAGSADSDEMSPSLGGGASGRAGESAKQTTSVTATEARNGALRNRLHLTQADSGKTAGDGAAVNSTAADNSSAQLEEIVVTAQKRVERIQDVPISIAVIGSEDVERRGVIGMEDYLRSIPGVNELDSGPRSNAIVIRGIATSPEAENFGSGATVATYFGETPITGVSGMAIGNIDVRPVDIERIEVLRGPQGTTFGDASLGGTLRIIPAQPKLDRFGAKLTAEYSDTSGFGSGNSMMQAMVNVPLVTDRFAIRAVGYRFDESGFYRNVAGQDSATLAAAALFGLAGSLQGYKQDDVGEIVSTGGRLAALWKATDSLSLTFNYLNQKIEQNGLPAASVSEFEQARVPIPAQVRVNGESGEVYQTKIDLASLTVNYDLNWAELTTVASWIEGGSRAAVAAPSNLLSRLGPSAQVVDADNESLIAETRLASHLGGRVQFLAGLFYQDVSEDPGFYGVYFFPGTGAPPFGTNPMALDDYRRHLDQRAIFGEISYALTDTLTATVGGRYFDYDKRTRILQEGGLRGGVPIGAGVPVTLTSSENRSNFKANLSYKPTPDALLYASWAQGFRLGQPSTGASPGLCDTNPVDGLIDGNGVSIESTRTIESDFLDNYEIGGKVAFMDRRVVLDTAIYHIKWDGLPTSVRASTLCAYTANAGTATSDGAELQARLLVTDGLRIDLGAGYTKAELAEAALGAPKGARLPGSPKVSANLAAQYTFDVAGRKAFIRADSFYTGKFYGDLLQTPGLAAGDYIKVDARAGVALGNLGVEIFVRNLTNENAFTWRGLVFNQGDFFGYRLRPRTVGLQLSYTFQ